MFSPNRTKGLQEGGVMHFYWRVIEELKYLGETLIFHDPCLLREYNYWIRKNSIESAVSLSEHDRNNFRCFDHSRFSPCLN